MSKELMDFVQYFLEDPKNCSMFCDQYIHHWKDERDKGELLLDDAKTSEALSSIFCLADLFNPDKSRDEYELDERNLRSEILKVLDPFTKNLR